MRRDSGVWCSNICIPLYYTAEHAAHGLYYMMPCVAFLTTWDVHHTTSYNKAHVQRVLQYDIVECICCYITQQDCDTTEHAAPEQHMHSTTLYYRTRCTWPLLYAYISHSANPTSHIHWSLYCMRTSHIQRHLKKRLVGIERDLLELIHRNTEVKCVIKRELCRHEKRRIKIKRDLTKSVL